MQTAAAPLIVPPLVTAEVIILATLLEVKSTKQAPEVNFVIVISLVPTALRPDSIKVPRPAVVTVIVIVKL
ncbi:hypothetical protein D3C85_971940 [compost metagenome]